MLSIFYVILFEFIIIVVILGLHIIYIVKVFQFFVIHISNKKCNCFATFLFCCFVVLLFCCFVVLLFCCFVVLLFCCFVVLLFCFVLLLFSLHVYRNFISTYGTLNIYRNIAILVEIITIRL